MIDIATYSLSRQPTRQVPDTWKHDKFEGAAVTPKRIGGGVGGRGSKLMISNLDYGVSDADVKVCCIESVCFVHVEEGMKHEFLTKAHQHA